MLDKKYKQYIDNNFIPEDNFEKLAKRMELKPTMKKNYIKYGLMGLSSVMVIGCLYFGVTYFMNSKAKDPTKLVTLSLDSDNVETLSTTDNNTTDITFAIDDNNRVVSVHGNNDIAKLVLVDEKLTNKKIDDALETIIDVEINTGLIVKGNVSKSANSLEISVSAELSDEANALLTKLHEDVSKKLSKENIQANIDKVEGKIIEELQEEVLRIDPNANINRMSYEDMMKVISTHYIETSYLYLTSLEDLYTEAKNHEIKFAEKEVVLDAVDKIEEAYQYLRNQYQELYTSLEKHIDDVNDLRYHLIIDPNSSFQKAYQDVVKAKNDLIVLRNEIANMSDDDLGKPIKQAELTVKLAAYNTALEALDTAKELVNAACDSTIELINKTVDAMKELEQKFPETIKDDINAALQEEENKVNEVKDKFFDEFEKAHKDDIEQIKAELKKQKDQLIESIKNA
ncbi:MAG: hypothetical protein SO253_04780 [Bacilli bacterium]|nr:hypothetical protein [Bacilli bacterium]